MATGICDKAGCTVADTGICLLSHADLSTCPNYRAAGGGREKAPEPVVPTPEAAEPLVVLGAQARRFPAGRELGTEEAAEIMRARYVCLVGILGSWNAGKTCFLLSLYLMASRRALPAQYVLAGSQTLPGFEERARRLRKWKGGPLPEQLADHTHLSDPRQPALLHLALREVGGSKRLFDVMLTDLPGEWSKNLVDRAAAAERFEFLHRADGIIAVVDGPLLDSNLRHSELQRTRHLLDRLVHSVGVDTTTPLVLLVSKCDELQMKRPTAVDEIEQHAKFLGFNPEVVLCAAFSRTPETVANGLGVFEALEKILRHTPAPRPESAPLPNSAASGRSFSNFGHQAS